MAEVHEQNWFRVCLNTIVRKDKELDSERLRILPMGSRVRVVKTVDRRVQIDQPIRGWCSLTSSNGDQILHRLDPEDLGVTTPQMRSTQGKAILTNQMQENDQNRVMKLKNQQVALENREIKRLYDDIQTIKEQLKRTEDKSSQLTEQQKVQKSIEHNKELNALQLEEYNEKIKNMRINLMNKQEEIQIQADQAGVENPDKLQGELDKLEKHSNVLKQEVEQNEKIMTQLQQEAENLADMMRQYVNVTGVEQNQVLKGDVLHLGNTFGMACVEFVSDGDGEDGLFYGCYLENPIGEDMIGSWQDEWPKLCNGAPHMDGYEENQCFFLPANHELTKKFLCGSKLLNKLEHVINLVLEAQIDDVRD